MTHATPRMISHSGLVCLPAAGNAAVGRRMASTKAHTSATRAASQSASKNQVSGVITPAENTPLGYLVRAPYGAESAGSTAAAAGPVPGSRLAGSPGVARGSGLAGPLLALAAWRAVERALALAGAAPVEGLLPALGQLVVLGRRARARGADISARAAGQRAHRGLVAPPGKPGGQLPQRFRGEYAGSCRGVHGLAVGKLAHLGPDINGAIHYRSHSPWPERAGLLGWCAGACAPELFWSVPSVPSPALPRPALPVPVPTPPAPSAPTPSRPAPPGPVPAACGPGPGSAAPPPTAVPGACASSAVSRRNDS